MRRVLIANRVFAGRCARRLSSFGAAMVALFLSFSSPSFAADVASDEGALPPKPKGDVREVVEHALAQTSEEYRERGFKNLAFGMERANVEAITGALTDVRRMPGWLIDKQRHIYLFDGNRLRGMVRRYDGDNKGYLNEIGKIFGKTPEDRIGTAVRNPTPGQTQVIANAEYVFPATLVNVETVDSWSQGRLSRTHGQETIFLSIYDLEWLKSRLCREMEAADAALRWVVENVARRAETASLDLATLPGPPDTTRTYAGAGKQADFNQSRGRALLEAAAFANDGKTVLVVDRVAEELGGAKGYDRLGTVRIQINPLWFGLGEALPLDRGTNAVLVRAVSGIAERALVPKEGQITWRKNKASVTKIYDWDTQSGWHVVVDGATIQLFRSPEKRLDL